MRLRCLQFFLSFYHAQYLEGQRSGLTGEVSERPMEHAWKVCIRKRIEGSNPSLSASQSWSFGPSRESCHEPRKRRGVAGCCLLRT